MSQPIRIDHSLFIDIVKQCYEAQKAEKEYIAQSIRDKKLYNLFSIHIRQTLYNYKSDNETKLKILDHWLDMTPKDIKKWNKHLDYIENMFESVEVFLQTINIL